MALKEYLEESEIDKIEDDQKFMQEEYSALQAYCEVCGYEITDEDLNVIKARGLYDSFMECKSTYVQDLWEGFREKLDPGTERIEETWRQFPKGTDRFRIVQWFEEAFHMKETDLAAGII